MGDERILDRERMQAEIVLKPAQFRFGRLEHADPDEFGPVGGAAHRLLERDRADQLSVAIEIGGDNAHGRPDSCEARTIAEVAENAGQSKPFVDRRPAL